MGYIIVIILTILAVLGFFYYLGWKVEQKKNMIHKQYLKQMQEIDMKKRKR